MAPHQTDANAPPAFTLHLTSINGRAKHRYPPALYRHGDTSTNAERAGSGSVVRLRISDSSVSADVNADVGLSPEFLDLILNGPAERVAAGHKPNLPKMIACTIS